ncbi:hypothetical protein NDR87_26310 [Nocardia sp. CDC159]|uniref:Secreted protein n=1 Tax=Nocardia pulmonis TaxID=2951408 RepID=A0A9X2EAT9_9NOCA|nr:MULTISPECIES: hypothetical protein [Nocardia]MCM6774961.1 hypothetical protein [Nocardia pulmonis]MCM6789892.1 hypothetical protein [Nocardia sp. CDC159]
MASLRRATIGAAAAAFLATGIMTAGAGSARAAEKSCGFEFTWTRPTVLPPQVLARGVAQCTVPPEEHIAVLKLEFRPAGGARWEVAAATPPNHTIPAREARYEVSGPCYAGSWRAVVEIWGSMQGHPFTFSDRSRSVDIPPSKCASRG